ncbi:hypothetical protein ABZY42_21160 [Streptomyces sp. NPDC006622]|uniref:hypothetical protein n=1 Tax=Streptomyces sp. NPDC006622 TaxID=3155459 RepID=UPI0033AC72DD
MALPVLLGKRHPGLIDRRHIEVCTLFWLTHGLRTGDMAVIGAGGMADAGQQQRGVRR